MKTKIMFFTVFLGCVLILVDAQHENRNCRITDSPKAIGYVEAHCSCMEQLVKMDDPIYKLVVNQTNCRQSALRLDWNALQSYIGVKEIVFDHATVIFNPLRARMLLNASVIELTFKNSIFETLPHDAFDGLYVIETIRMINTTINVIETGAFKGFRRLATIEFDNCTIDKIKSKSFQELSSIEDLAFIRCKIGVLESFAIDMTSKSITPAPKRCPVSLTRSRAMTDNFVEGLIGRSLVSLDDVSLPEHGSRLLFFSSIITEIEPSSIRSNMLSYIIFAANEIEMMQSRGIIVTLSNHCEISALLVIANNISSVESNAFSEVSGNINDPYNTVLALINNRFVHVYRKGFLINPDLKVPYVSGNQFLCECEKFSWILSDETSEVQNALERNVLNSSSCFDSKMSLVEFLKIKCNDDSNSGLDNEVEVPTTTDIFDYFYVTDTPDIISSASVLMHSTILISLFTFLFKWI